MKKKKYFSEIKIPKHCFTVDYISETTFVSEIKI